MTTNNFDIDVIMSEFGGKCKTVSGLDVEILKTDVRRPYHPILGVVTYPDDSQQIHAWQTDGLRRSHLPCVEDLTMPTPRIERWLVVNHEGIQTSQWSNLEEAQSVCPDEWFIEHRVIENGVLTIGVLGP